MLQKTKMTFLRLFAIIGFVILFAIASISLASCSSDETYITNMSVDSSGNLVVTDSNGDSTTYDVSGSDGSDGVGIKSMDYSDGVLTITLTDGKTTTYTVGSTGDSCSHTNTSGEDAYVEVFTITGASCTQEGVCLYVCGNGCGSAIIRTTAKTSHEFKHLTKSANCTEDGYDKWQCANCQTIWEKGVDYGLAEGVDADYTEAITIPATGHSYKKDGAVVTIVEASCEGEGTEGKVMYTCDTCGTVTYETIPVPAHSLVAIGDLVVFEGTNECEDGGYQVYRCENCNYSESQYEEGKGHKVASYEETATPTAYAAGALTGKCIVCGNTVTVELDKLTSSASKTYAITDDSATAECNDYVITTYAYTVTLTSASGEETTKTYTWTVEAADTRGHALAEGVYVQAGGEINLQDSKYAGYYSSDNTGKIFRTTTDSTGDVCDVNAYNGTGVFYCDECQEYISVKLRLPHAYVDYNSEYSGYDSTSAYVPVVATCGTAGYHYQICTVCGAYSDKKTDAATGNHNYAYALETEKGKVELNTAGTAYIYNECSSDYKTTSEKYSLVTYCTVCGTNKTTEIEDTPEWKTVTAATCTTAGQQQAEITLSGNVTQIITMEIPALGHSYNKNTMPSSSTVIYVNKSEGYAYYIDGEKTVVLYGTYNGTTVELGSNVNEIIIALGEGQTAVCDKNDTTRLGSYQCDVCGEYYQITVIAAHTIKEGTYVTHAATCTADKYDTYTCSVCNSEVTIDYAGTKIAHNYEDDLIEITEKNYSELNTKYGASLTASNAGSWLYVSVCSMCSGNATGTPKVLSESDFTVVSKYEGNCKEESYTVYKYNDTKITVYGDLGNHGIIVSDAFYGVNFTSDYVYSVSDGKVYVTYKGETTEVEGISASDLLITKGESSSCDEQNSTPSIGAMIKCSVCEEYIQLYYKTAHHLEDLSGTALIDGYISGDNGSWTSVSKGDTLKNEANSCGSDGCYYRQCTECGYVEKITIEATGHNYTTYTVSEVSSTSVTFKLTCATCDDTIYYTVLLADMTKTDNDDATCETTTTYTYTYTIVDTSKNTYCALSYTTEAGIIPGANHTFAKDSSGNVLIYVITVDKIDSTYYYYYKYCTVCGEVVKDTDKTVEKTVVNIGSLVSAGTLSKTTYSTDTVLYSDSEGTKVTVTADSTKTVSIDSNKKEIDDTTFTERLKLGGAGSADSRSIKVELTAGATITVYAMSSSSGTARTLALYDSTYTVVDDTQSNDGTAIQKFTYTVTTSGTYYIASTSGGMNVYCITIA